MTQAEFSAVLGLIQQAQSRALQRVNRELIELYWSIGQDLSQKTQAAGWGRGTVQELADWLTGQRAGGRGFSASNLWRMRQFYDVCSASPKLAALLRELSWTNNLTILSRAGSEQKREFYLQAASRRRWSFREPERQMDGSLDERALARSASPALVACSLTELPDTALVEAKLEKPWNWPPNMPDHFSGQARSMAV